MKKAIASIALGLVAASIAATGASAQATLANVKQKGVLVCGSNPALAGFGLPDAQGNWTGLDVELCRAVAAAIFDDPNKVRFIPLSAKDRFTALQSGEVDLLSRNSTVTMSRAGSTRVLIAQMTSFQSRASMSSSTTITHLVYMNCRR